MRSVSSGADPALFFSSGVLFGLQPRRALKRPILVESAGKGSLGF
jgi:hypothetical protein